MAWNLKSYGIRSKLKYFCVALVGSSIFLSAAQIGLANHVVMEGGPFLGVVVSIAVDPVDSNNLYCAAYGGGVFRSRDRGASWTTINQGLPDRQVFALAVHPSDPRQLLVGTDQGVFQSMDSGDSWRPLTRLLKDRNIRALLVDPLKNGTMYIATDRGVFWGKGETWQRLSKGLPTDDVRALALSPHGTLFAGTFGGVFKKGKNEPAWTPMNSGLEDKKVRALVFDPSHPNTLYAGTALGGVFKSVDGGHRWQPANRGLLNSTVLSLAVTPLPQQAIYAGTIDGGFKSQDGGNHWFATGDGLAFTVPTIAFDPAEPRRLYAGSGGHLFKTTDGGKHWQELSHQVDYFGPPPLAANPREAGVDLQ